ncbi:MAG: DUF5050 domain-containing protein [Oscillospiraceae bacterium]|jgi:hypothetical protein|nr:DUF5050 domain-containing protein [Oscillospiraceae bacterium]
MKKCVLTAFVILILLVGCSGNKSDIDTNTFVAEDIKTEHSAETVFQSTVMLEPASTDTHTIYIEDPDEFNDIPLNILGSYGDARYAWRIEGDNCVLYSIDYDSSAKKLVAVFQPDRFEHTDYVQVKYIVDFGICENWIILCVGYYQGSGNYFYGDFVRLKKDGSDLEHFWLTEDDGFIVVDDWVYYFYWAQEGTSRYNPCEPWGCYRIRPDGGEKEYLGDKIYRVLLYAEDGYFYGFSQTNETVHGLNPVWNLIRCKPDGSEAITLFLGSTLPEFDSSDFIEYSKVVAEDEYISFTASVHGYRDGDNWLGSYVYMADYRVDKDSNNLVLLSERQQELPWGIHGKDWNSATSVQSIF